MNLSNVVMVVFLALLLFALIKYPLLRKKWAFRGVFLLSALFISTLYFQPISAPQGAFIKSFAQLPLVGKVVQNIIEEPVQQQVIFQEQVQAKQEQKSELDSIVDNALIDLGLPQEKKAEFIQKAEQIVEKERDIQKELPDEKKNDEKKFFEKQEYDLKSSDPEFKEELKNKTCAEKTVMECV